jgi:mono/diheme cytochrome c family protein
MRNRKFWLIAAVVVCGFALMAGYNRPYRWWPVNDMSEQEYIKAFTTDSGRAPAPGTVAVGAPDVVPPTLEFAMKLGDHPDFEKPPSAASSPESIARGEELYNIYCKVCHGQDMGPTPEMKSAVYKRVNGALPAADIHRLTASPIYSDEYIFAIITHGSASGLMKRMSYHLSPEERWDVVNYVRSLVDKYKK